LDNPWLAMEVGADASARSATLRAAHEAFMVTGAVAEPVRDVVADSWRRSAALVGPDTIAPVHVTDGELEAYRVDHPLARVMPLLRDLLGTIAYDGAHLMGLSDADGLLLWVEGHPGVVRGAENTNVIAGARWDEVNVGTTATGIALAVDHAVQIFGAEHFTRSLHHFTCAAAPIHDPQTGATLGAVNVSGGPHLASPQSLALVQATARAAEAELASMLPGLPPTAPHLRVLGRDQAILDVGGTRHRLGRRHSEILVLLATHPEGLSAERLAWELYGDRSANPATLRAELSRLRQLLGPVIASRPYRLAEPVVADFVTVADLARSASVADALRAYAGPLLPGSGAPGIRQLRDDLETRVREAVLRSADRELLKRWATSPSGESDLEAWESVAAGLPVGSELYKRATARAATLRRIYGAASEDDAEIRRVPRQRTED
jgi:hypothetical protein